LHIGRKIDVTIKWEELPFGGTSKQQQACRHQLECWWKMLGAASNVQNSKILELSEVQLKANFKLKSLFVRIVMTH
jgi:hypothetical protein